MRPAQPPPSYFLPRLTSHALPLALDRAPVVPSRRPFRPERPGLDDHPTNRNILHSRRSRTPETVYAMRVRLALEHLPLLPRNPLN